MKTVVKYILLFIAIALSFNILADHNMNKQEVTYARFNDDVRDINEAVITLKQEGGSFAVKGHSMWKPLTDTMPPMSLIDGKVKFKDSIAEYVSGNCSLTLELDNEELIVSGYKSECGGLYVTFDGIYKIVKE